MRGGEETRRGGFAGEEQAVVNGGGEHGALAGVAGERMRIGAARKRVVAPARFPEWRQFAAKIVAEQGRDLVDRLRCQRADPRVPHFRRKAAAEEALDAGLAERTQVEAAHLGAHGSATET